MRVDADQFERVLMAQDVLEHGERRAVGHGAHRRGKRLVSLGDLLVAQVVRVFHVVLQLARLLRTVRSNRTNTVFAPAGGSCPRNGLRMVLLHKPRVGHSRGRRGRLGGERVEHTEPASVRAGGQQRHTELLILVRGGDVLVTACVDAGGDAQHHLGTFAELFGDGGDARRLVGRVDDDLREALLNGERDLLVGLVVAVEHEATSGGTGGERDLHLAHRAGVDEHARFGDDAHNLLGEERLAGKAHVRGGRVERVRGGFDEVPGAVAHLVGVDEVERRAELVEQRCGGAPVEGERAGFGVDGRGGRPDRGDGHGDHIFPGAETPSRSRPAAMTA